MINAVNNNGFSDIKLRIELYSQQSLVNSFAKENKNLYNYNSSKKSNNPIVDPTIISQEAQNTLTNYYDKLTNNILGYDSSKFNMKLGDMWMGKYNSDSATPLEKINYLNNAIAAYSSDTYNAEAYVKLGDIYSDLGMEEQSISSYQRALQIDNKNYDALVAMGDYYKNNDELDKAVEEYKKAMSANPFDYDSYLKASQLEHDRGNDDKAIEIINEGLRYNPDNNDLKNLEKTITEQSQSEV